MVDLSPDIVAALKTILPVHYELKLTKGTKTPCISYQERNNADNVTGDTIGYSNVSYTIKVWGHEISELNRYACLIDKALRPMGFSRISGNELHDKNSTMIQKILAYEALASEEY